MRVTHITKATGVAGSEGHLLRLLPALRRLGLEAGLLVLEDPRRPVHAYVEALTEAGVPVRTVPIRGHLDTGVVGRLAAHLRDLRPDVVHTHLLHADLYGIWAASRAGVPHVVSSRHNDDPFRRNPLIRLANRAAMRRAGRVIVISHALAGFVERVEGVPRSKIVTIHYGLDAPPPDESARGRARQALGVDRDVPLVGFVGRLVRQKGADVLLDAFVRVRGAIPSAKLALIGDGAERVGLERRAGRLGLGGSAFSTGWLDGAADLMSAFDVLAVPSRWEGFGLVTLEAMARAVPVVASRVSALPEIVAEGQTGLLVPPDDPGALADALATLLGDPARARALGQAGRRRLESEFSVERMARATLEVYRGLG
jgi:glycosyltransferase involved in cell wall biosynthesis